MDGAPDTHPELAAMEEHNAETAHAAAAAAAQGGAQAANVPVVGTVAHTDLLVAGQTWPDVLAAAPNKAALLEGVHNMNFQAPSRIQAAILPFFFGSQGHIVGQSQSGTGKTACFGLALLSTVDPSIPHPQGLVLAPARELALQTKEVITKLGCGIKNLCVLGCVPGYDSTGGVRAHVVVGTAGKVHDVVSKRRLQTDMLRVYVLDEADVMIDQTDINRGRPGPPRVGNAEAAMGIRRMLPPTCRVMLFSATYPEKVRQYAMNMAAGAKLFRVQERNLNLPYIKQVIVRTATAEEKLKYLQDIYAVCDINQSIIFVNTREAAKSLAQILRDRQFTVALLQAEMTPEERDKVVNEFRQQNSRVLIATNVIARGLDVPQTSIVINYQVPALATTGEPDGETYLHRVGRTGRFGREGVAINLVDTQREEAMLQRVAEMYGISMPVIDSNPSSLREFVGSEVS